MTINDLISRCERIPEKYRNKEVLFTSKDELLDFNNLECFISKPFLCKDTYGEEFLVFPEDDEEIKELTKEGWKAVTEEEVPIIDISEVVMTYVTK